MPCSAGRELKQMLINATNELAAANDAMADPAVLQAQRERRLQNAKRNHNWTSSTLLKHLASCSACRERQSAVRPAYKEVALPPLPR
jgi:hypothetical protein